MENANDEIGDEEQHTEYSDMQDDEEKDEEIDDEEIKDENDDFKDEEHELEEAESKKINTLKFKVPKQKNMYFNEQHVLELIDKYQKSLVYDEDKKIIKKDEDAEQEILANLLLVARAIINKYHYWRFAEVEDMESECLKECWKYLPKFDTTKGTAFNLFSILCKRHLLNYTLRLKKHRLTADIDIHPEKEAEQEENYSFFFEGMESNFLKIINEHYIKDKRKKYIELTSILMEYLDKNKTIVGKNDLISVFREYGYKSSDYKEFILDMKQYEKSFYDLAS